MRHRDGTWPQISVEATSAYYPTVRAGVLCVLGFASALFVGCGELEPMREPEVVDLELTTDTLKASVRDAQRMVTELRTDLETQRRDLADAQVSRAQLEGRVKEAERRVVEARQVIELQREELAAARKERTYVSRSNLQLQGQMRQLQKQLSRTGKLSPLHGGQEVVPLPSSDTLHEGQKAMRVPAQRNQPSESPEMPQIVAASVAMLPALANRETSPGVEEWMAPTKYVSVKPGDTLWRIARKYRVHLDHLRSLNRLTDNRIVIGQALWLPDDRSTSREGDDKGASTP